MAEQRFLIMMKNPVSTSVRRSIKWASIETLERNDRIGASNEVETVLRTALRMVRLLLKLVY